MLALLPFSSGELRQSRENNAYTNKKTPKKYQKNNSKIHKITIQYTI